MTKKRLQKKVKEQQQEIHRLTTIINNASRISMNLATVERYYTDATTRYAFYKMSNKLIEKLGENK